MLLNKLLLREDSTPPRVVSDGKSLLLDSETAGDEPYMLASNLKDVVVLVDKNRVKSGRYAIENFGCDTLLLDDGFQYWKLAGRRQDVVLVDCQQPFGNEHLFPRGTLREPPSHLARASVIFITKSDGKTAELRQRISHYSPGTGIIECIHAPLYFEDVFTGERKGLDFLQGQRVASLQRHRPAGKLRAKPGQAVPRTGLFQTLRRPSSLHPAGNPQRHQPQQKTPGRRHRHHAKGRRPLSQTGPPRPAHLFHARGNQNPQRRGGL